MSEWHVQVVRLGPLVKHPNADSLSIVNVYGGYPAIVKTADFQEGDLAVYLPVDSMVPETPAFAFLGTHRRIRAARLRGIFSMGLLIKADPSFTEGEIVAEKLGIIKYEPPEDMSVGGECEPGPTGFTFASYTDIEGLRRHPNILVPGEEVGMTEKIHGTNMRALHDGTRLWVGSNHQIKRQNERNVMWKIAVKLNLEERLAKFPMHIVFGEAYGKVQDLNYGISSGADFRVFDMFDTKTMSYLDHDDMLEKARSLGLELVPELFRGPWDPKVAYELAEGQSTLSGASNVREGVVIKPVRERFHQECGRVILKLHGTDFLLRKQKS